MLNHKHTDIPVAELQGMSNQKLVQLGAQWCITSDATIYSGDGSLEKPLSPYLGIVPTESLLIAAGKDC